MLLMLHVYQPCSDGIVETVTRPGIPRDVTDAARLPPVQHCSDGIVKTVTRPGIPRDVTDAARLPPVQWRDSEDSIVLSGVC